jgi:hypothetical protein
VQRAGGDGAGHQDESYSGTASHCPNCALKCSPLSTVPQAAPCSPYSVSKIRKRLCEDGTPADIP